MYGGLSEQPNHKQLQSDSVPVATGVVLSGASGWAFQRDGLITLTENSSFNGNAIVVEKGNDVEFYSSNKLGAING